jgi:hypothetical protein
MTKECLKKRFDKANLSYPKIGEPINIKSLPTLRQFSAKN